MITSNLFGHFAHELLPVLAQLDDIPAATRDSCLVIRDTLVNKANANRRTKQANALSQLDDTDWEGIFEVWIYLLDLLSFADEIFFEPRFPNGRQPDLVVRYRNQIYVIEIKTNTFQDYETYIYNIRPTTFPDEIHQIVHTANYLSKASGRDKRIYAFKLVFINLQTPPPAGLTVEPVWIDMFESHAPKATHPH